ncbi:MAG: DUF3429 domain-containing protein [Pseudomonadota bacterium]
MNAPVMLYADEKERFSPTNATDHTSVPLQHERTEPFNGAAAATLAYLAATPLLIGALGLVAREDWNEILVSGLMASYGAALIIFFAGVRWGVAVMKPGGPSMRALGGAALPFVLALPLLMPFDPLLRIPCIMVAMVALLLDDMATTRRGDGAPAWYLAVRLPLTVLVEVAFAVALAASFAA